ncbi:putative transcription factor bHLH144 [Iris pallida]|uniref:Transcription factor bHLH144 n=1 Tax=Iris pallida TaxID=29817 RepID=A0AAX6G1U9_IRIPA|nr:putative transcription factor bHLH144 [Iris pallida]
MQRKPSLSNGKVSPTDLYGVGGNTCNLQFGGHYTYGAPIAHPVAAALAGTNREFPACPLDGIEFQPMDTCPRNFVIFDQTENKSRVMFHPALARKLNYPYNFNDCANDAHEGGNNPETNDENQDDVSSLKENTADIDALLSSDDDDEEDDVVSTGRSPADWAGSSPNYSDEDEQDSTSSHRSCSSGASSSGSGNRRKRERMREMVKVLRGVIPGGDSMDTPAVLDEAVKYLKSLKVEVKKLGIHNFKNY